MATIKLSEWCNRSGVSYITAYRWFKADKFPVYAYQTETGTILVEDEEQSSEDRAEKEQANNDAIASFFKKTLEYSKANRPIEDFAAYVASNFNLEMKNSLNERLTSFSLPRRAKPAPAEAQGHFQKFLQKPTKKPAPNMFLMDEQTLNEISEADTGSFMNSELADKLRGANVLEQPVSKAMSESPAINLIANEMQKQISAPIKSTIKILNAVSSGFPGDEPEDVVTDADLAAMVDEYTITYDKAREIVDQMVQVHIVDDDPLVIDRRAKEICKWPHTAINSLKNLLAELPGSKNKKMNKGKK